MDTILIILLIILIIINVNYNVSSFTSLYPQGCKKNDRTYPEGKVPGSYLGLNKFESGGLLTKFINNSPHDKII